MIRCFKIADNTGSIYISVWGKAGEYLDVGDICVIKNSYCNLFRNSMMVYVGKGGTLTRVGSFTLPFKSKPFMQNSTTKATP